MNRFDLPRSFSRRELLRTASCGFGYLALAGLCSEVVASEDSTNPLAPKKPDFPARAKRVIFLYMAGAPSHVDTFDYKPALERDNGKSADGKGKGRKLLKSPFKFQQHGKGGLWLPEIFPNLGKHADDLCLLNSLHTDLPNHPQATVQMHTGNFRFVRPSMGAWALYGLGTENQELPGFITINPPGGAQNYGSAFLPAMYQGTRIGGDNRGGAQVANLGNSKLSTELQRKQLDLLQDINRDRLKEDVMLRAKTIGGAGFQAPRTCRGPPAVIRRASLRRRRNALRRRSSKQRSRWQANRPIPTPRRRNYS